MSDRAVPAIRPAQPRDAEAIAAIYAPHVRHGTASFEVEPPDGAAIRLRMAASDGLYPWLVATDQADAVIGYAYAARFRERAAYRFVVETTIYVDAAAQGLGVARPLYGALLAILRAQGFVQAIGVIALPNAASVGLHEATGFRAAGVYRGVGYKHDRWIDVGIWQRELNAPTVPPVEPRRFDDVGIALP